MLLSYTNGGLEYNGRVRHIPRYKVLALAAKEPLTAEAACMEAVSFPAFFTGAYVL